MQHTCYSAARTKLATGRPKRMRMGALAMMSRCRRMGASLTALRDLRTHAQAGQLGTRRARGGRRLCGRGRGGNGLVAGRVVELGEVLVEESSWAAHTTLPCATCCQQFCKPHRAEAQHLGLRPTWCAAGAPHADSARGTYDAAVTGQLYQRTRCSTVQYSRFTQTHEFRAMYNSSS